MDQDPDIRDLIQEYGDLVLTLCMRIICDPRLAEEAVQDTFVKAYRNLKTFRSEASMKTWIYRIAYNTAIDYSRKRKRLIPMEDLPVHTDQTMDVQTTMEQQEQNTFIHAAIDSLPVDLRSLISLYYLEEKSIKEVCTIAGMTESNVKIKLFRARKQLASILSSLKKKQNHD